MTGPELPGMLPDWPEELVTDEVSGLSGTTATAVFSKTRTYRYLLTRQWDDAEPLTWIMLNPSTADAFALDPTVTRCVGFARLHGFGGVRVLNLFGLRATDPRVLRIHPDPVGPSNDLYLQAATGGTVIAAWGADAYAAHRAAEVAARFARIGIPLSCLGVTKDGAPKHPLARGRERVPDDAPLIPWKAAS